MVSVIFDLDNTLYDAKQYFSGAFNEIAAYLSKKHNVAGNNTYKRLMKIWKTKTSTYPYLFDDLLNNLELKNELKNTIKIFNEHDSLLKPYDDVIPTLKELKKKNFKLGIITDGNIERQKRKMKSLGIADFFDVIVLTKKLGNPKPSEIPFQKATNKLKVIPQNSFYVGDNPLIDFKGAKKIGMKTIRILKGEFKTISKDKYIDYEIKEIKELLNIIEGGKIWY